MDTNKAEQIFLEIKSMVDDFIATSDGEPIGELEFRILPPKPDKITKADLKKYRNKIKPPKTRDVTFAFHIKVRTPKFFSF